MKGPAILEHTLSPSERLVVRELAARVKERYGTKLDRVVVFGSRARGDVTADSDIDLLVLLEIPVAEETEATRVVWELTAGAQRRVPDEYVPLAPVVLAAERFAALRRRERRFALDVEAEGIPL